MKNTIEELKQNIINHYMTASCDSYGQLSTISIGTIAKTDEQKEALNSLINVSTYGGRYGTYKAFNPWHSFKDFELEQQCRKAFAQNENRKRNVNQY